MANAKEYYGHPRPELREFVPTGHGRVLEVGCGHGAFRPNLAPTLRCGASSPMPGAAELARTRLDRVFEGTFESVEHELPDATFDLVVCNDVIEHMPDDVAFLHRIQRKMRPEAHLVGSIPNVRYWPVLRALVFDKIWDYQDESVLDRTHLRFYTIRSFPKLLTSTGFELLRIQGINRLERPGRCWHWLNRLPHGLLDDTLFLQFAFVAKLAR